MFPICSSFRWYFPAGDTVVGSYGIFRNKMRHSTVLRVREVFKLQQDEKRLSRQEEAQRRLGENLSGRKRNAVSVVLDVLHMQISNPEPRFQIQCERNQFQKGLCFALWWESCSPGYPLRSKNDLEIIILLPPPSRCWDYRHVWFYIGAGDQIQSLMHTRQAIC